MPGWKFAVKWVLLLFVGISILNGIAMELRPTATAVPTNPSPGSQGPQFSKSPPVHQPGSMAPALVYYFHGNTRCVTCKSIQSQTMDALLNNFQPEIDSGRLQYRLVNLDTAGNEHFTREFQLTARIVVLAEGEQSPHVRFRCLPEVWNLVRDKPAFANYIKTEVRAFLEGK